LILNLPDEADDVAIAREANARHILVRPLSRYYLTARVRKAIDGICQPAGNADGAGVQRPAWCLQTHCPQALAEAEKQNAPT
jgi:GntR family transcriptional regulator/MocR family aminotransferase